MKFRRVLFNYRSRLLSECGKYWIVKYPETYMRRTFFQVYKSVEHVPRGMYPWCRDNRRMGGENGFQTLRDAVNFLNAI